MAQISQASQPSQASVGYSQEDMQLPKNEFAELDAKETGDENDEDDEDDEDDANDEIGDNNDNSRAESQREDETDGDSESDTASGDFAKPKDIGNMLSDEESEPEEPKPSGLEYIMNYKKRGFAAEESSVQSQEEEIGKAKQRKLTSGSFVAGTRTKEKSFLFNNKQVIMEHQDLRFSDQDFETYHKMRQMQKKLDAIKEKEQLVKILEPKEFRFKMFLEDNIEKLIQSVPKLSTMSSMDLQRFKSEYKNQFLRYKQFQASEKRFKKYKTQIQQLNKEKFEIVPYTPGCTPWKLGRKYLTINSIGNVWIETKTTIPIVTFSTYDKSSRQDACFNVDHVYDIGYLDTRGILLAQSGYFIEGENETDFKGLEKIKRIVHVLYKPHANEASKLEINVELLQNEYISTVGISRGHAVIFMNTGLERRVNLVTGMTSSLYKRVPTLCFVSNGVFNTEFTIGCSDRYLRKFVYSIACENEQLRTINTAMPIVSAQDTMQLIKGVFFNDYGYPCFVDQSEFLYLIKESGIAPVLNFVEALNRYNSSYNNLTYFPISTLGSSVQVLILKDEVLETKFRLIEAKVHKAQKEVVLLEEQLAEEKRINNLPANRKKEIKENESLVKKIEQKKRFIAKRDELIQRALDRNDERDGDSDVSLVDKSLNFPWFPLPGITNFEWDFPETCSQLSEVHSKFNDPKLLKGGEKDTFGQEFDDLFEESPLTGSSWDSQIAGDSQVDKTSFGTSLTIDLVHASLNRGKCALDTNELRNMLQKSYLEHDANLLKVLSLYIKENKVKLAFNAAKNLKLGRSYDLLGKICKVHNFSGAKFMRALKHWRDKKVSKWRQIDSLC